MSSIEKVSDLLARKAEIALGGGKEKLEKQKQSGSLTARERIEALLDGGSFIELGAFVKGRGGDTACDGVITGYGSVDGKLVYVYSQDVTVLNGAVGELYAQKIENVFDMALKMGAPVIGMIDSDGVRLGEGTVAQAAMGKIITSAAKVSGVIPNISIVFGNCAGGSAIAAAMSDFVIINEKKGRMFVNGPAVVEASTGKSASVDAKGSVNESGNAHLIGKDDEECTQLARLLLTYLPSNNLSDAFEFETDDDINRTSEILKDIDSIEDVRIVVSEVADDKAFFEIQGGYANEIVTGFIRLNGSTVGTVASNGEALSGRAVQKAARFVRFCDCYNIPVLTFTDVDGFTVSASEEVWGLAKKGAELAYAFAGATVAKVNVVIKKAYSTAYTLMNSKQSGADVVFAYPTAEMAPLAPAAGVGMLYSDRLKAGENREALENEYKETEASVYNAAKSGYVDDIIDPAETRQRVIAALEMLKSKRAQSPARKHDNMPL
ncbi:MAG: carboxyl transferase domain-containing protein [Clostridia bacterium]|nr:carboxyl transferase domain-containing protein [Clostridia bacterium]